MLEKEVFRLCIFMPLILQINYLSGLFLASSKKKGDWNTDTKVKAKDFDELLQTQQEETSKPLCLQNSEHEKLKHYEGGKLTCNS